MDKQKIPGIWALTSGPFQKIDGELLESGMLADAEVKCVRRTWKVHKIILCTRSDWFKKALMGPFEEGQTGTVTITNFKQAEMDCFLKFVYTGTINLRDSYPRVAPLPALMKVWKMADFFCLGILHDLVIKAAKDCSREMALVFCALDPPPTHDQKKDRLFSREFVPAVKAIYEDEMESLKHDFAPIILGLAVASIHSFSKMEAFEQLLQEIPLFSADWATALMKGISHPRWQTDPQGWNNSDSCSWCRAPITSSGVVDTMHFMRHSSTNFICTGCYEGPNLEDWKNNRGWW